MLLQNIAYLDWEFLSYNERLLNIHEISIKVSLLFAILGL